MLKELNTVKDLLEEEYGFYSEQLSKAQDFLSEQEKKIKEQERFIVILEQEKEEKGEFLSAYNSDDSLMQRIKEEKEKKKQIEKECQETKNEIIDLSNKTKKYEEALEQLCIVNQEDHIIVSEQLVKEIEEVLNEAAVEYTKSIKSFSKTVEEYMYMDPERVKVELQKFMKENKAYTGKIKSIRKKIHEQ